MHKSNAVPCSKELDECKFDIASDGITYTPFCGSGDKKDLDHFISWEDLRIIFMEDRENLRNVRKQAKANHIMSDGEEHGTDYLNND